jgi:hypothetical protein
MSRGGGRKHGSDSSADAGAYNAQKERLLFQGYGKVLLDGTSDLAANLNSFAGGFCFRRNHGIDNALNAYLGSVAGVLHRFINFASRLGSSSPGTFRHASDPVGDIPGGAGSTVETEAILVSPKIIHRIPRPRKHAETGFSRIALFNCSTKEPVLLVVPSVAMVIGEIPCCGYILVYLLHGALQFKLFGVQPAQAGDQKVCCSVWFLCAGQHSRYDAVMLD